MEFTRQYRYILSVLVWVIPFFFVPFLYMGLFFANYDVEAHCYTGTLFVSTPAMNGVQNFLIGIWFLGVLTGLLEYLRDFIMVKLLIRNKAFPVNKDVIMIMEDMCKKLKASSRIQVYYSAFLPSPVVTGIFSKSIILPEKDYTKRELEIIFTHELIHVKQHIMVWKGVARFVRIIHWFNPIAYLVAAQLDKWAEIACDISVHNYEGRNFTIREYFNLGLEQLNRYMEKQKKYKGNGTTHFWEDNSLLERVEIMKKYDAKRDMKKGLAAVLVFCFCLCSGMTTFAAGLGVNEAFEKAYKATQEDAIIRTYEKDGQTVYVDKFDINADNVVIMDDPVPVARTVQGFNWSVPKGKMYSSLGFYSKKGNTIMIMTKPSPTNKVYRAGVVDAAGYRNYVYGSGNMYFEFTSPTSGFHRIFIENISDTTIAVDGSYIY